MSKGGAAHRTDAGRRPRSHPDRPSGYTGHRSVARCAGSDRIAPCGPPSPCNESFRIRSAIITIPRQIRRINVKRPDVVRHHDGAVARGRGMPVWPHRPLAQPFSSLRAGWAFPLSSDEIGAKAADFRVPAFKVSTIRPRCHTKLQSICKLCRDLPVRECRGTRAKISENCGPERHLRHGHAHSSQNSQIRHGRPPYGTKR